MKYLIDQKLTIHPTLRIRGYGITPITPSYEIDRKVFYNMQSEIDMAISFS